MSLKTEEQAIELVRQKLNAEKVKLWLEPYTTPDGRKGEHPTELIASYSRQLKLPEPIVEMIVEQLRDHAVQKLNSAKKFRETGIASLKVRLAGVPADLNVNTSLELSVEVSMTVRGGDLKHTIANLTGIPAGRFKLISSGHSIQDNLTLEQQNVKNFANLLAICLTKEEVANIQEEEHAARIAKTRQVTEMLINDAGDNDDDYHLQVADQNGRPLDLPLEERKALAMAMMLHEKGRSALKRKETGLALVYFLEADNEFKKCSSSILGMVDNYGLLCLDIVWCYLCLQHMSSLPDAEERLKTCEDRLKKSYGQNLERVTRVKGGAGNEQALIMRLHLLQGVLAFHKGQNHEAGVTLAKAEDELRILRVDEIPLMQVMEMGFTEQEARLGVRFSRGNIQLAVAHITEQREEKAKRLKEEKEEKKIKRLERKLGKTANGQQVSVPVYNMLVSMGFTRGSAAEALRQSNNDIQLALQVLQDNPDLLNLPDPEKPDQVVTDAMVQQLVMMGFNPDVVYAALHHFGADIQRASEELLRTGGQGLEDWFKSIPLSPTASSTNTASDMSTNSADSNEMSNEERVKLITDEIIPDIPKDEQEYLDLSLDEESAILQEYKARLASLQ